MLDRLGGVTAADADRSTTALGDWYANVLFRKPQLALFVSEVTMLPVLIPFAPAATLLDRFPSALAALHQAHGARRRFTESELGEMVHAGWPRRRVEPCSG